MTGICAILDFDTPRGVDEKLRPVADALAWRSSRRQIQRLGPVTMASVGRWTPEERETLRSEPASELAAVGDMRIDNRSELAADLGLGSAVGPMSDLELLLRCYRRWGPQAVDHLVGDFAFVLWDGGSRSLLAARDHIGMKALFYACPRPGLLVVATDAGAVAAFPEIDRAPSQPAIAEFLGVPVHSDPARSFYRSVSRLPPAHRLLIKADSRSVQRYWSLEPPDEFRPADARDYVAGFREHFDRAVEDRLRGPGRVGSMLSGGIDSASVSAVAARMLEGAGSPPLPVFSVIDDEDAGCRETAAIREGQRHLRVQPRSVGIAALLTDPAFDPSHDPVIDPRDWQSPLLRAVYRAASEDGVRIVLDGAGGDTAFAFGDLPVWLFRQGDFAEVWRLERATARQYGSSERLSFLRGLYRAFEPSGMGAARRRFSASWGTSRSRDAGPAHRLFAQEQLRASRRLAPGQGTRQFESWTHQRVATMTADYLAEARERYDRAAARHGIEARDPFSDIRLLRFLASLPPDQVSRNGLQKWLMRAALERDLPPELRFRAGKTHLGRKLLLGLHAGRDRAQAAKPLKRDYPAYAGQTANDPLVGSEMVQLRGASLHRWLTNV